LAEPESARADDFKPVLSVFHPVHSFKFSFSVSRRHDYRSNLHTLNHGTDTPMSGEFRKAKSL